jgi:hypothetical protein
VDVHGTDLDVGAPVWSDTLVRIGLPFRLAQLPTRRRRLAPGTAAAHTGRWLLRTTGGPAHLVTAHLVTATTHDATVEPVDGTAGEEAPTGAVPDGVAVVEGTGADVLAVLLGRPTFTPPDAHAAVAAASFAAAFPGP